MRRYMRLALTEPRATISVSLEQRKAAAMALAVLLPSALPETFLNSFPSQQKASADALRGMLSAVWELEPACMHLAEGGLAATNKFIAAAQGSSKRLPNDAGDPDGTASLSACIAAQTLLAGPAPAARPPVEVQAADAASTVAAAAAAAVAVPAVAGAEDDRGITAGADGAPAQGQGAAAAAAADAP